MALASDESAQRISSANLSPLASGHRDATTVIENKSVTDHASHTLHKRSLRRQSHHVIVERRPLSRGPPPRRRRRPPKFSGSFRPKGRPKPPKPIYGPPNYSHGKPIGYVLMNQNNEVIHQGQDYADLPSHFFDTRIPANFINDGPPPPYQEEPEIIPSVAFESHASHRPSFSNHGPAPSLASEEVSTWTHYEEKPKVRRKKPSTTPEPTPPSEYPRYSAQLKPQPPSTSYGVPVAPFSVSNFNPWLSGFTKTSQESSFHKTPSFPTPTRQKTPSQSQYSHSSSSNYPSQFELEQDEEKNLYEGQVSSYDVPLNYVSTEPKPTFKKKPVTSYKFPTENFESESFENNPSSSFQSYLPPQLPESYNEEDFSGVTRNRHQENPPDYSGEYVNSEEALEQPLTFSFKKPSSNSVTRKPVKVFRQTTSAQEAFENFVRELRPSLTTASPPTAPSTMYLPQPTTRRPRLPTASQRPRLRPTITHNLDTDDLREAYIENSGSQEDYTYDHEPVNFESMRYHPSSSDSRPSASDKKPHNFVLVSSANREKHHTTSTENYPKHHPGFLAKPSNIDIISIQPSKSKSYYAGSTTPSTRPPRANHRGTHRQYTKSQISRQDDFSLLHGENYNSNPPISSQKFNPALHFTKTFSSKITQPYHSNHRYHQQVMWNGQELPKNHKITNRDT